MKMLHILLAEDNRGDVLLVRRALQEHGIPHQLHVAQDGAEAMKFIAHMGKTGGLPCPDIVLLDLNLPVFDGPQVLTELRKDPECLHASVIVVTSSDAPNDRAHMAELGISYYFRKPSDLDAFMELGAVVKAVARGETAQL
jgi:CheY-like chemotaxis protein